MARDWDNFAVILGSAAGALTGLLFVVISLNREPGGRPRSADGERAKFAELSADDQLYRLLDVVSPNFFSMLCVTIAGCLQLAGGNGLYWLAAAIVLALGGGVVNAWLILIR